MITIGIYGEGPTLEGEVKLEPGDKIQLTRSDDHNSIIIESLVKDLADLDDVGGVPADGEVLAWDQAAGLWLPQAAPGAGDESFERYRKLDDNHYHTSTRIAALAGGVNPGANVLTANPFFVATRVKVTHLMGPCSSSSAGKARFGLYADDGSTYPGALIVGTGEFDTGGAGVKLADIVDQVLSPGLYWLALIQSGAASWWSAPYVAPVLGWPGTGPTYYRHYTRALGYGPMPDPWGAGGTKQPLSAPAVSLRLRPP